MIGCILYGLSAWTFCGLILSAIVSSFFFKAHKSSKTTGMSFGEKFYWEPDERGRRLQKQVQRLVSFALISFGIGVFVEFFGLLLGLLSPDTVCPSWVQAPRALRMLS